MRSPPGVALPGAVQRREVDAQVALVAVALVAGVGGDVEGHDLADDHGVARSVDGLPDPTDVAVRGVVVGERNMRDPDDRVRHVLVGERFSDGVDHVDAEPVDPPVEPEPEHIELRFGEIVVLPVDVGLLGQEQVEVVPARRLVELPRRAAVGERGRPVRGRPTVGARVCPDEPVALGIVCRGDGVDEPPVRRRDVVGDEVDDAPQPGVVEGPKQRVEVVHVAEDRVDTAVVADVVAVVEHGRLVER